MAGARLFRCPLAQIAALALGFWPVWRWYWMRMGDGSDEPLGLAALLAACCFLPRGRRLWLEPRGLPGLRLAGAAAATLAYIVVFAVVPPLIRAMLAVTAVALLLPASRGEPRLPLHTLLLLSLPLIATLQYFLGYPVRVVTAWCTARLLGLAGHAVEAHGTMLAWAGEEILLDAPCSGIRMLWAGAALSAALACLHRLPVRKYLLLAGVTGATIFVGNVARSVVLFFLETGLWPNPAWAHEATGIIIFIASLLLSALAASRLARSPSVRLTASRAADASAGSRRRAPAAAWAAVCLLPLGGLAGFRPLVPDASHVRSKPVQPAADIAWPAEFEGMALVPARLHPIEESFAREFPGAFAAFTDGRRRVVFRRIETATRKVHPAAGCLRASGFSVEPLPALRRAGSGLWGVVRASKRGRELKVREQIRGSDGSIWTDVSAWYWAALFRPQSGPWMAVTVMEDG